MTTTEGEGRGVPYTGRDGAAKTYREARARARALKPQNWRHYLELARVHGLPTQPQTLWPKQWEEGGRFAGFIGAGTTEDRISERNLVSAAEARERLGIGHATWKLLVGDMKPTSAVRHKMYYSQRSLLSTLAARLDRIKRSDARDALSGAIEKWSLENSDE